MSTITRLLAPLAALVVAVLAPAWLAPRESVSAAPLGGRRVLYYVDPMHPSYHSEKPGTAPDCGMALTPVYADRAGTETHQPAPLDVDAATQQVIGVRVIAVEARSGSETLRLFGRVVPDETRTYRINVGVDGYVRNVSSATTGSLVRRGDVLATFSTADSRQPIQAFLTTVEVAARAAAIENESPGQVALATSGLDQATDRLLTLGLSPAQIDEIRRTRVVPTAIRVAAPADGFVIARNLTAGQKFERGAELYRLADLRQVWIAADVPARDAGAVRPGLGAEVAVPGRATPLSAHVSGDVPAQFDAAAQTIAVRLVADNPDFALRPGMFVDVRLQVPYAPTLTIPAEAIVRSGLRDTVFVEASPGRFEPRQVTVGRQLGDRVEILSGVTAGERIAASGTFLLDSESRMARHDQPPH